MMNDNNVVPCLLYLYVQQIMITTTLIRKTSKYGFKYSKKIFQQFKSLQFMIARFRLVDLATLKLISFYDVGELDLYMTITVIT